MSWEDSEPVNHACPCGKSTYFVMDRSDDWGRFEQRWGMDCHQCARNYRLYSYVTFHKGLRYEAHGWAKKTLFDELMSCNKECDVARGRLQRHLMRNYKARWLEHFAGTNKKAVWCALTREGDSYPSLDTFYDHVRRGGLARVLMGYLTDRHADIVVRVLRLKDEKLDAMAEQIQATLAKMQKKETELRSALFT